MQAAVQLPVDSSLNNHTKAVTIKKRIVPNVKASLARSLFQLLPDDSGKSEGERISECNGRTSGASASHLADKCTTVSSYAVSIPNPFQAWETLADVDRDNGLQIQRNLDVFGKNLLSDDTLVTVLEAAGECGSWSIRCQRQGCRSFVSRVGRTNMVSRKF